MNDKITSSPSDPIYTSNVNPLSAPVITASQAENACVNGNYYVASSGTLTVAVGGYLGFQLINPTGSGVNLNVNRLTGGSQTKTSISTLISATFTTAAALVTISINNTNTIYSAKNSVMIGKYSVMTSNPSFGGTPLLSLVTGSSGGTLDYLYAGSIIFGPGSTFFATVQNNDNQISTISINLGWWEQQ